MIRGVQLCEHIGWPVFFLVGDNSMCGANCSPLYTFLGCLAT